MSRGKALGVHIEIGQREIRVAVTTAAPTTRALVVHPEHIVILDGHSSIKDDGEGDHPINQVTYRTVGAERVEQDDHIEETDSSDVMRAIRNCLPDGNCQKIFDIWAQTGEAYEDFSAEYGDGQAKISHIAAFLSISPKAVTNYRDQIKHHSLVLLGT